jgi:hypothetical protein
MTVERLCAPKRDGRDEPGNDKSGMRCYFLSMLIIETEREDDGRWLAEVPALPGMMSYGATDAKARSSATAWCCA